MTGIFVIGDMGVVTLSEVTKAGWFLLGHPMHESMIISPVRLASPVRRWCS